MRRRTSRSPGPFLKKSRTLLQFCVLLLAGAGCLAAQSKNPADLSAGKILVATRRGTDSIFAKSVILLVRYDQTGALGLMVNRRSTVPISHVLPELQGAAEHSEPVFVGGPVELRAVFGLVRAPRKPEGATERSGDIYLLASKTALATALGAVVLVAAVGFVGVLTQWRRAIASELLTRQNAYASDMNLAQRALEAGVLDEVQIHQIPVLFGGGRRLFELWPSRIELEIIKVIDPPEATHIRYRVRR